MTSNLKPTCFEMLPELLRPCWKGLLPSGFRDFKDVFMFTLKNLEKWSNLTHVFFQVG